MLIGFRNKFVPKFVINKTKDDEMNSRRNKCSMIQNKDTIFTPMFVSTTFFKLLYCKLN